MNALAVVTGLFWLALYTIFSTIRRIRTSNAERKREVLHRLNVSDNHRTKFVGFFHPYW